VLDAYTPVLRSATPSDTSLLLVTVARLQHVSSYTWLQGVLDHCQDSMMAFDGQVRWTLAVCLRSFSSAFAYPVVGLPVVLCVCVSLWWRNICAGVSASSQ
jgi:hypothetical protein